MGNPGSCPAAMVLKPHQVALVGRSGGGVFMCVCMGVVVVSDVVPGSQKLIYS